MLCAELTGPALDFPRVIGDRSHQALEDTGLARWGAGLAFTSPCQALHLGCCVIVIRVEL